MLRCTAAANLVHLETFITFAAQRFFFFKIGLKNQQNMTLGRIYSSFLIICFGRLQGILEPVSPASTVLQTIIKCYWSPWELGIDWGVVDDAAPTSHNGLISKFIMLELNIEVFLCAIDPVTGRDWRWSKGVRRLAAMRIISVKVKDLVHLPVRRDQGSLVMYF